ncbi:MAG: hypothetical protein QGG48_10880, partial [Desulfatiglandales bacterium]|nr:hypothetical protein [Desulfatiglandales bacterium]
ITDGHARLEKEKKDVSLKIENIINGSQRKTEAREASAIKFEEIEKEILSEQKKGDELDQIKKKIEMDLKMAETNLNVFQSRLSSLRSLTENFEGYKIGVRTIMKAKDLEARKEGRIMGLVADVIQVEPKYEQAVEAVLADKLQYIIVESQKDGKEAVDYLKVRARGRSSFVPVADLNGKKENGHQNGFVLLRDFVSVPDHYRHLIDALLEDAALVEDLGQAISAWRNNGRDQCLVTPEGDIVDQRGIISGGKLTHSSHGLLARKREVKELEEKVAHGTKEVEELKIKLEKVYLDMEQGRTSMDGLIEEKSICQKKINDFDKMIFQLSQELDQLERLSRRISDELEKRNKDQVKHKEALGRIESELRLCREKRKQEEEHVRLKELETKESEEEFEQIRDEQEKLKMDYGLSQEEERGLLREIERVDDFTQEGQQRIERIEEDISGGQQRHQECLGKEEALQEELESVYEKLEHEEGRVNGAEL